MKHSTHIITIMKKLLTGKSLTSSDMIASNSNQYFRTIKKNGIALIEVWKPNLINAGKHKERSLHQSIENISKAKHYLRALQGRTRKVQ